MKRRIAALCTIMCILLLVYTSTVTAAQSPETLTIKGDGVAREVTFSRTELESMAAGITRHIYSAANNFPTDKIMYRQGVSLLYLLEQAGIKDTASQLKFISSDGYTRSFTYQELLGDIRYYFAKDGSKVPVPTIIAFADSAKDFSSMKDVELVLTMGQRVKGEQNNPWFVKYLETIEVSSAQPERWPQVTFSQSTGPEGITVKLEHSNFDAVKIYYTLDGTNPTIKSSLYNISASYYQPQLNQPLSVKEGTVIKAIAIGAGKLDSAVASIIASRQDKLVFNDLDDYPWAVAAIEDLAGKNIIAGMGNSSFAPGESLTRAQFAVMIIKALGEQPSTKESVSFNDVKAKDWHFPYVQKAAELGLIKGYPDGSFRPDQILSREEMLTVVVQAMNVNPTVSAELLKPFESENRISDWARVYIASAESLGVLEHGHIAVKTNSGLAIDAKSPASRAEAAMTVYLMLKQ